MRWRRTVVALLVSGCGSSAAGGGPDATTLDGGHAETGPIRRDSGSKHDSGPRLRTRDGGGETGGTLGCSGDLRSVVNAAGDVVVTCPADEGCASGACIDACAAAAKSRGSLGCDYWLATPVTYDVEVGQGEPCFGMFVANTWPTAAVVSVSYAGEAYEPTTFAHVPGPSAPAGWPALGASGIPESNVAVLYLSGAPDVQFHEIAGDVLSCPGATATGDSTAPVWTTAAGGGTGKYEGFHVTTSVPVTAYDIFPFGGATSFFPGAELLYPSSAWGTNYVVLATPAGTASPSRLKYVDILAYEDGTSVTFSPSVDLPGGGGYPAVAAKTSTTFTLNAGEYAHWETAAASNDLAGSIVLANNPVSVAAGDDFFRLQPFSEPGGEATHVQIAPTSALGHDYAVSPYTTRRADLEEESIFYRIVGIVDGTTLTFDPPEPDAPSTTGQAQVSDFQVVGAFRVTSQDANHPFSIAEVMSTGNLNFDGGTYRKDCATITVSGFPLTCGDEDFIPLVPPAQFLSRYVFFTDPTYSTTTLDLVRVKQAGSFADVTVDCLGAVTGWEPIGTSGDYEYARTDLLRAVPPGTSPDGGRCTNGRHEATSTSPFGLVVHGLDTYASYGYPAGGNAAVLSGVVVAPPK
jgi:hypothetical protein